MLFLYDGSPVDFSGTVHNFLNTTLPQKWVSCGGGPITCWYLKKINNIFISIEEECICECALKPLLKNANKLDCIEFVLSYLHFLNNGNLQYVRWSLYC